MATHGVTVVLTINSDEALELEIGTCRARLLAAGTPHDRRAEWLAMAAAIKRRSPEQVAKMEREQGLIRADVGNRNVN